MSPFDIVAEHALGSVPKQRHLDSFAAEGVPALNLAKTWRGHYSWILRDRVVFTGSDCFEFGRYAKGDAVSAYTFILENEFGEPFDIAAWRPPTLALWLGRASVLGEEQVCGPRLDDPLVVHETVLGWLQAARQGIFVVNYRHAAQLLRCENLVVATAEHARFLRRELTLAAPPIRVGTSDFLYNIQDYGAAA